MSNTPGRFVARRDKGISREMVKYALIGLFFIIIAANVLGLYPVIPFNALVSSAVYVAFFASLFLLEKNSASLEARVQVRLYYIIFALALTIADISGGVASPVKWAVYVLIFAAAASRQYLHAGIMLAVLLFSFLKHLDAFAVHDTFSFIAVAAFIAVYYFTGGRKPGPGVKTPVYDFESGKESRDFKAIASGLLEKLLNVYRQLIGAETLMFFVKEAGQEGEFTLMMFSSNNPAGIDGNYRLKIKEGILGAAINKKERSRK